MDYHSPKDDKTRIGGFNNPPSPAGNSQQDSYQPAAPAPSPYWQSPPKEDLYRAPPTPDPYRPAPPTPDPYRPPQPAPDLYRPSTQQDDMWFVVDLPGRPAEYPLRQGESVTLGRDAAQHIVIEDKTLSRSHVVMQRNGDRITVQVMGLNGLVYANQVYKSTTIEVTVPATLTIGNVACRIKKKFDSDATIMMSDPAIAARQRPGSGFPSNDGAFSSRPPQASFPLSTSAPVLPPGEHQPFGMPAQEEKFPFPASHQPIPPVFPTGQPAAEFPGSPYPLPSFDFGPNTPPAGSRDDISTGSPSIYERGGKPKGNKNLLLIASGVGLGVLLVVTCLFFWLQRPSPPEEKSTETKPPVQAPTPSASEQSTSQPKTNNLYLQYLIWAKSDFEKGNNKIACDYLKDIPPTSAYHSEAVDLAKQIGDCKLE